jgi:ribosomal protein L7/L12
MKELSIQGWNLGLDKILLTKTLRAEFGYSLTDGKAITDRVLANEEVRIPLEGRSIEDCNEVLRKLQETGAKVSVSSPD